MSLKRNDIVLVPAIRRDEDGNVTEVDRAHMFYGRVNHRIDADTVQVAYCGRNWQACRDEWLELDNDYRGTWDWGRGPHDDHPYPVFSRMPSLRKLKQRASEYEPKVWRKQRDD